MSRKTPWVVSTLAVVAVGTLGFMMFALANTQNLTSSVTVGTAVPSIPTITVNHGSAITLTANATHNVDVNATITDGSGCTQITGGTTTVLLYRSGVTSSTCFTTANPLDCYSATSFTTSSCLSGTEVTTTTFALQYFAQATDSSSSYSGQTWMATVDFTASGGATGTADSAAGVTLNTLTAINVTTSSINYGTISASSTTGSADQVTTTTNAGNSSTSLQLYASATLTSSPNVIATSSQGYSTAPFTYPGASVALTSAAVTVSGFTLTSPTSTTNVQAPVYWGLGVPNGTPTGTYTGTNVFQALFSQ